MIPVTHKEEKYYESLKYCHICKKKFYNNKDDKRYKKYHKVSIIQENLEMLHIAFVI